MAEFSNNPPPFNIGGSFPPNEIGVRTAETPPDFDKVLLSTHSELKDLAFHFLGLTFSEMMQFAEFVKQSKINSYSEKHEIVEKVHAWAKEVNETEAK